MKKLIILSFVIISTFAKAQSGLDVLPLQNDKVMFYRGDFLDAKKDTMFTRTRYWMANNTDTVLQTADITTGSIKGTGHFIIKLKDGDYANMNSRFDYRLQIICFEDDRYSFTIDSLTFTQLGANGSPINGSIPLETMTKTTKANANAINTQFQTIYFSFIDGITNIAAYSNAISNYSTPLSGQLYLDLIKKTVVRVSHSVSYDTPDKEVIQLSKYFSSNGSADITTTLLILRPVAEATDQPVLLTFDDGSQNSITSKSYWTKKGDQYQYKFAFTPNDQQMALLKQKKLQKIQMAETTINIDDLLASKVKAWANYLSSLAIVVSAYPSQQNKFGVLPEVNGKVAYESIVDMPGKTQDFIFNAANKWLLDNYNSQRNINQNGIILSEDKDQGQILAKAGFRFTEEGNLLHPGYSWMSIFNIQIDCKDNKYRIRLYNMSYGTDFNDKNPIDMEYYNGEIKSSRADIVHQTGYSLDARFKSVMQSLADAVNKAAHDDF